MNDRLLRPSEVEAAKGLSVRRLENLRRADREAGAVGAVGPAWLLIGERCIAYRESDVDAWIDKQATSTAEQLARA